MTELLEGFVIDHFVVESGRAFTGIVKDRKLLVRAHVKGRHVAVNFTEAGAERMGIMLCKYLDYCRETKKMEAERN